MRKTTTKRALLTSVMALLLCFTMLLGTTFAWFTDTASSTGNKIVAGTLEVKLLMYANGDYVNISDESKPIFGDGAIAENSLNTLWEPGKTQVAYLAIENAGNLDLKYDVVLTVKDNNGKKLHEVMQYAITPDAMGTDAEAPDWTVGLDVVEGEQTVAEATALGAKKTHYFALSLHMLAEAGNDYQAGDITFDITVRATQLASEEDSFGNEYDANLDLMNTGVSRDLEDGSTVFYSNEDDSVTLLALPENLGSEYVVPAEVTDLGTKLQGVTLDKLVISANVTNAYKALDSATIGEVIIEEGATTIPDRMFYKAKVDSIVIPDSVTTIETNAFAQATATTLTIPASITDLGDVAFGYMPNLETVYIESSAALPHYAFRACPKLSTVVFTGDVNIGTTSIIFSNYESGGKDDMTFYVTSEENAEALKACLGTYNDTATGTNRNKWTVIVGIPTP